MLTKTLKLAGLVSATALLSTTAFAGALNGTQWNTIDDNTGKKRSVVVFSESNGVVSGKILKIYDPADAKKVCKKCKGALKNKPVQGLQIIKGFKSTDNKVWSGGRVLDPENGKEYKGKIKLSKDGKELELRGYVGIPTFGRSQTWKRLK